MLAIKKTLKTGMFQTIDYRVKQNDKSWSILEGKLQLLPGENGDGNHLLLVAHDVTSRKNAELDRADLEVQLRQSQKLEAVGQLAAGIAHEINTPTQHINDNVCFLKEAFEDISEVLQSYKSLQSAARKKGLFERVLNEIEILLEKADLEYLEAEIPQALTHGGLETCGSRPLVLKLKR